MTITKFYILESQMFIMSSNITGKRQVTIDSVWIDKAAAKRYVDMMKKLQSMSAHPTIFKLTELKMKKISDIKINCCNNEVSLNVCFTHDSVNQYGDIRKDEYYSISIAIGHNEVTQFSNTKQYLKVTGNEVIGFNFKNWNGKEFVEGRTIRESFVESYKAWADQMVNL